MTRPYDLPRTLRLQPRNRRVRIDAEAHATAADAREVDPLDSRSILSRIGLLGVTLSLALGIGLVSSGTASAATPSYLATYNTTGDVSTISTDVVIPTYTCAKGDAVDAFANAYDSDSSDATPYSGAYLVLGCSKKNKPELDIALEIDGTYEYAAVVMAQGDTVQLVVSCGPSGTTVSATDETNTNGDTDAVPTASSCEDAYIGDIGVGDGSGQRTLPDFHALDFSNAEVNSAALGSFTPTKTDYHEGAANVIKVKPFTNGGLDFATKQKGT
jgi:hypothetical protein